LLLLLLPPPPPESGRDGTAPAETGAMPTAGLQRRGRAPLLPRRRS